VGYISSIIKTHDISPSQLEFEITESISMYNLNETLRILTELNAIGVSIAIDDFGTGHSSLLYLKKFPIKL
jgi:EAL domain-containing protein (putative c-di-GMP-specific phosphodiesterase class I)